MERLNRLTESNGELTSGTNNKLIAWERNLKLSGKSIEEQSKLLDEYKTKSLAAQKANKASSADYLARALAPQITDIGVGLATGQSPLTVLLQQGGQLRDQFGQFNIAAEDMGKILIDSSKKMVKSIKDVAFAIGDVLLTSLKSLASTIGGGMFTLLTDGFKALFMGGEAAAASLERVKLAAMGLGKVGLVALVATMVALAKGFYDSVIQSDALVKQLTLTGGSLGMAKDQAMMYANSLDLAGVSTTKALTVITAMAKEGGFLATQIPLVTRAATDMQIYAGIAIEDTVKAFAKMRDEPVKGMFELARATGMVPAETIKAVIALEKHGKTAEATAQALKTLADVNSEQIEKMKKDYSSFAIMMKTLGSGIAEWWDNVFKDIWTKADPSSVLTNRLKVVQASLDTTGIGEGFKKQLTEEKAALEEQIRLLGKASAVEQDRKAAASATAKAYEDFNKDQEQFATNREKREKEISEVTIRNQKLITAGIITQAQHEEQIANIRKKYKDEQRSLTFYESEIQNAQKMAAVYEDAQINMNEAQKRMVALATDPRFLEESHKKQQQIMIELVNASNKINQKSRAEYGLKETRGIFEETEALRVQGEMIGATDEAKIKYNRTLEAAKKYREEEAAINLKSWDTGEKELEQMAALDRYNQRILNADTEIANMLKAERVNAYGNAFQHAFDGMADAITNFALTGKLSFSGLIDAMLTDLIRFEMRAQTTAIYKSLGGASGLMNMFTGGNQFEADINTSGFATQAKGGAWSDGMQMFAKGGSFTNSIVDSPTLFKFAKGTGMMGEAGPEAIMPLRRGSDGSLGVQAQGGGSNVQVSVINNTSTPAITQESTDSRGNRRVEVIIGDMTAGEVQRSGSASQKALKSTYGMQPNLIRR